MKKYCNLRPNFQGKSLLYMMYCDRTLEEDDFAATKFIAKELKKLHISLYGWYLFEVPCKGVYIFASYKSGKEITIITYKIGAAYDFEITVYDHNTFENVHFDCLKEALKNPIQSELCSFSVSR